jgi:hypothetical protein
MFPQHHSKEQNRETPNGKVYLEVKDETFAKAGKIGLWSKADAQTPFAGLKAKE